MGSTLKGRTAAITGASRGFGAAIKSAIEARGAGVYHVSRSCEDHPPDRTILGDAKEPAILDELRRLILKDQGRLDFLICNAFPTPRPLRLEPAALGRIAGYLSEAVMMTLAPLCMLLETLNESGGVLVLISSAWVESPVREWPHYLAAKSASEMLARVAPIQFPNVGTLIVRPAKMQTAWTNTPLGWPDAKPVQVFAERLATRLEHPIERGVTEIIEME